MTFKDHFSGHARDYAKFRPHYPKALFAYLAGVCASRDAAWDCATGNGQAALPLAEFFKEVIATDASENQVRSAQAHPRAEFRVAQAEDSGLPSGSVDLITVAQALHWFDLDSFYSEARRVLKPNGVIAVWSYNLLKISPEIDALVDRYYRDTVGSYWPFERKVVEDGYRTIPFPFEELQPPEFAMRTRWSLNQLIGYLQTWSATKAYLAANGLDPVSLIESELSATWGNLSHERDVSWPLSLRVGQATPLEHQRPTLNAQHPTSNSEV